MPDEDDGASRRTAQERPQLQHGRADGEQRGDDQYPIAYSASARAQQIVLVRIDLVLQRLGRVADLPHILSDDLVGDRRPLDIGMGRLHFGRGMMRVGLCRNAFFRLLQMPRRAGKMDGLIVQVRLRLCRLPGDLRSRASAAKQSQKRARDQKGGIEPMSCHMDSRISRPEWSDGE